MIPDVYTAFHSADSCGVDSTQEASVCVVAVGVAVAVAVAEDVAVAVAVASAVATPSDRGAGSFGCLFFSTSQASNAALMLLGMRTVSMMWTAPFAACTGDPGAAAWISGGGLLWRAGGQEGRPTDLVIWRGDRGHAVHVNGAVRPELDDEHERVAVERVDLEVVPDLRRVDAVVEDVVLQHLSELRRVAREVREEVGRKGREGVVVGRKNREG